MNKNNKEHLRIYLLNETDQMNLIEWSNNYLETLTLKQLKALYELHKIDKE